MASEPTQKEPGEEKQGVTPGKKGLILAYMAAGVKVPMRVDKPDQPIEHETLWRLRVSMTPSAWPLGDTYYLHEKWCKACQRWLDGDCYTPKPDAPDGLYYECRDCRTGRKQRERELLRPAWEVVTQAQRELEEERALRRALEQELAALKAAKVAPLQEGLLAKGQELLAELQRLRGREGQ